MRKPETHSMNTSFFGEMLQTISERGRALLERTRRVDGKTRSADLVELCEELLSGRGEASGVALAREILVVMRRSRPGRASRSSRRWQIASGRTALGWTPRLRPGGNRHPMKARASCTRRLSRGGQELLRRLNLAPRRHRLRSSRCANNCSMRWITATISLSSMPISSTCSRPGSTVGFWCCAALTGRRRPISWKRSSATKPSTKSALGRICAGASIRPIVSATPSFTLRWSTSR